MNTFNIDMLHSLLSLDGKGLHIGTYDSEEAAARAYDNAAKLHKGEFAILNFQGAA